MEYVRKGIFCAGNIGVDQLYLVNQFPGEGELSDTQYIYEFGGGAVLNVLINLAILKPELDLYAGGIIGEDLYGRSLLDDLQKHYIDTSFVFRPPGAKTSFSLVFINKNNGQRTLLYKPGANNLIDIEHIKYEKINARIFHLAYLNLLKNLNKKDPEYDRRSARLLHEVKKTGMKVSLDLVSTDMEDYREVVMPALKYVDYLIINEIEAEKASGIDILSNKEIDFAKMELACDKLLDDGVGEFVCVHFDDGAILKTKAGQFYYEPSLANNNEEIKSTLGAGDAFCSGLLLGVHEEMELELSLKIAQVKALECLTRYQSIAGKMSLTDVLNWLKKLKI